MFLPPKSRNAYICGPDLVSAATVASFQATVSSAVLEFLNTQVAARVQEQLMGPFGVQSVALAGKAPDAVLFANYIFVGVDTTVVHESSSSSSSNTGGASSRESPSDSSSASSGARTIPTAFFGASHNSIMRFYMNATFSLQGGADTNHKSFDFGAAPGDVTPCDLATVPTPMPFSSSPAPGGAPIMFPLLSGVRLSTVREDKRRKRRRGERIFCRACGV